jgi:hypothetical protein
MPLTKMTKAVSLIHYSEKSFRVYPEKVEITLVPVIKLNETIQDGYTNGPSNLVTWVITPTATPRVIRLCGKCNKKMDFYCSEKFRLNGNHTKIDIWLIYKCIKCDTTWKLTIKKGIKPHDMPVETFEHFINNDKDLAWRYAFDRNLLGQKKCELDYSGVNYEISGFDPADINGPLWARIVCLYPFELKLSAFLARVLGVSVSEIKRLAGSGRIRVKPECDMVKCRIRGEVIVYLGGD